MNSNLMVFHASFLDQNDLQITSIIYMTFYSDTTNADESIFAKKNKFIIDDLKTKIHKIRTTF